MSSAFISLSGAQTANRQAYRNMLNRSSGGFRSRKIDVDIITAKQKYITQHREDIEKVNRQIGKIAKITYLSIIIAIALVLLVIL